ncbi:hypothetical protein N181_08270 [Sinorhizobium fredii USDA 205]|uniref:SxtJ n=1 Tax=Rhizobium fredii TaxID=380 RepID=A0A844AMR6_RHIFR|nr:hypothetical protein [Sinorhizobium fredii]ASY72301.1 hypothetical protein SF83666_b56520 [Sinorhizobium fredii CCBAU 83666]KSV92008.1 hypothetical protein N181_08270 [Sinorhizobium fredii USDA 205]MQX12892.1 hypothetical protein [Sinorhizobium fredii]GEC33487.1 hypothetical protein EFR01_36580 [Sinorhizobium fredii]GLS11123.1 hypothetical protein GCM10007864_47540 [Sinorhizobium fredii]
MNQSHESFSEHALEGPSNRSFGYTVGGILLAFVLLRWLISGELTAITIGLAIIGGVLVLLAFALPDWLALPNRLWTKLGLLLFMIVNPLVMLLIYATAFIPIGLVLRLRGYDPLAASFDKSVDTYWNKRSPHEPDPATMRNQF